MKTIFTAAILLFNLLLFAQEAGKAGELLRNEASSSEMQTSRNGSESRDKAVNKKDATVLDNSTYRRPPINSNPRSRNNTRYRWNYNYGNSEVFVRIPQAGNFTVEVGDQYMGNATGKFRFFDLRPGMVPITIYENNDLIYRTRLTVQNSSRLVLDFFSDHGLYLLGNYPVQNQIYGLNEWDDLWNNPYTNLNTNPPNNYYPRNVLNPQEFSNFMGALKKNASFDKDRMTMITSLGRDVKFTAQQIYIMLKEFSFDDNRLQTAKNLSFQCVDRQNFYVVYDAFSFDRYKKQLSEFLASR